MNEIEFYYVVQREDEKPVHVFRISVGVRHSGLNNAVRSLMAFANFELDRFSEHSEKHGMWAPRGKSFSIRSESQFEIVREKTYGAYGIDVDNLPTTQCANPTELFNAIGYDPKRKRYTGPTSAMA